jgi:diacylglycerol O-acyltransferase
MDTWERLRQIHEVTAAAKRNLHTFGVTFMTEGLDFVPPWLVRRFVHRRFRRRIGHPERVNHNITVSNFKGFETHGTMPAIVEEAYFSGPPNLGVGVNVSVWSYVGQLMIAVTTSMDSMDEPKEFINAIMDSFDELLTLSRDRGWKP